MKSEWTVCRIINRYEENKKANYKKLKRRKPSNSTLKCIHKVEKFIKKNPSISNKATAKKINLTELTLMYLKWKKLGLADLRNKSA